VGDLAAISPAFVPPEVRVYIRSSEGDRLRQGEILEALPQVRLALGSVGDGGAVESPEVETDPHPLGVVLSQDCDLEQDYDARKTSAGILPNILLCDVFNAAQLKAKLKERDRLGSKEWRMVRQNNNPRFQFLRSVTVEEDLRSQGMPALAVDFRLYFTIRTDELYRRLEQRVTLRRCWLSTPYAEHLCDRFCHYLARIALPVDHGDEGEAYSPVTDSGGTSDTAPGS